MAQLTTHKYTVAWFRLAEFVMMGKKQQALSIFRLLAYSLPDEAIASQLEGDLLLSFADKKALQAYTRAAILYEKQGKYMQAVALYEHLLTIEPDSFEYASNYVKVARSFNNQLKMFRALAVFVNACIVHRKLDELEALIKEELEPKERNSVYEGLILYTLTHNLEVTPDIYQYVQEVILFLSHCDEARLETFLLTLQQHNEEVYDYATDYFLAKQL